MTATDTRELIIKSAMACFGRHGLLFSLFTTPSSALDMDDDEVVAHFVRSYAVRGFVADRPVRRS
jgi:hypothetical protein